MRVLTPRRQELLLDQKDWRFLKEYISNVRQPLSQIAKRCLLSRQAVEYRLRLLQEKGLLTGSRAVINIHQLGYKSYHIFLEAHVPQHEKEIRQRAEKAPFVNALIVYSGKYNLEISIMARDEEEFLDYYRQLINDVRVRDDQVLVLIKTITAEVLPSRYFPRLKSIREKDLWTKSKNASSRNQFEPDLTDLKILFALSRDAVRTNLSLARELKVSKDTIPYRLKKLERSGFLLGYRPVVNYAALGLTVNSLLVKLNYSQTLSEKFESYLRSNSSVLWAAKTMGYYDYLIYVMSKDLDEFHQVISGIKEGFDDIIKTYEILFAFEELKYNFMADSILENPVRKISY